MNNARYMNEDGTAKLIAVRDYYGYRTLAEFKEDWDKLSDVDKLWFRVEVGKAIKAGEITL